jgi:hypothetical protein
MSLNQIQLSPKLLSELYADVLIETDAIAVPAPVPQNNASSHLGNNGKNIMIFVKHPSLPYMPDAELAFLTSVLSACKLELADVAIVNLWGKENKGEEYMMELAAKNVLLFDIQPLEIGLPINFPHFQLQQFNKRTYLYSPSLSLVESDKSLKTKLWTSLKTLFCL